MHDKNGNELDRPAFGIPKTYMSVHHNEYISDEMVTGYYGPTWWFKVTNNTPTPPRTCAPLC